MDRFIEPLIEWSKSENKNLKSNMDRFIADVAVRSTCSVAFKIQYG